MNQNSDTQDVVETTATENTGVESQEPNSPETGNQEPDTGELDENGEPKTEPEKPKRNRAQERVEQAVKRALEAERKLKEYEAQKEAPKAEAKPSKPQIEDFESYEQWTKAHDEYEEKLDEWRISEAERRILEKQGKSKEEESKTQRQVEFESAMTELEDEGYDADALNQKLETLPPLPLDLNEFGLSAKETLIVAAKLIEDTDLWMDLSQMSAVQAARKIGQEIDKHISKPTPPPVSKAPKPIKPVQANAPAVRDASKMSDDEWYRAETQNRNKGK
ncbi:hypothetical protein FY048_01585 [Acinetobacter sp. 1124_18A]|uniref:hypothetical protein n=1 Tax=Acinetobacter sp. 1124_18A TaxID=2605958 RepID=UPI004057D382